MKEKEYYDEIANWSFENINYKTERNCKWDFYGEIKKYTDYNSICLDLGTGGGEKLLKNYPNVKMVIGTDFSSKMIETAKVNLKTYNREDVKFLKMNNLKIEFKDNTFNVISARHTVINGKELYRTLKEKGIVIIEGVDKDDCIELKNIFKRGQAYNDKKAISKIDYEDLVDSGFKIIKNIRIEEYEYYKTKEDLLALLLKTPIIDDFSNYEKKIIEPELLDKYIEKYTTPKGILLKRVLYGIVAIKE